MTPRIFISSLPADDALCTQLAAMLEGRGCTVWRHRQRSPSAAYRALTAAAIGDAEIVVVLWSAASRVSPWVIDEADAGMKKGTTVAVEVGGAHGPLGFSGAVRVRAASGGTAFSKADEAAIWEAVADAADARGLLHQGRVWLDRSLIASLVNGVTTLALFGALAVLMAAVHGPRIFVGLRGAELSAALAAGAICFGYAADAALQRFGTRPRAYRRRAATRWLAEATGAGLAAFIFVCGLNRGRSGFDLSWLSDAVEFFLGGFAALSLLVLGIKYIPLLASRRLQQFVLGRPG